MKKVLVMVALVMVSVIVYAFNDSGESNQGKKEVTGNGEVVVMDKEMFLKDVFDYVKSKEWNYKGNKPAIIDLYADWCGPCRQTAPIMKELAKEYAGKIILNGISYPTIKRRNLSYGKAKQNHHHGSGNGGNTYPKFESLLSFDTGSNH